jgi:hypothetical protein
VITTSPRHAVPADHKIACFDKNKYNLPVFSLSSGVGKMEKVSQTFIGSSLRGVAGC